MHDWLSALLEFRLQQVPCVLVTIVATQGSTPQGVGSKMVVTDSATIGSIGGGATEFQASNIARSLLQQTQSAYVHTFTPEHSHCGGITQLLFEPFLPSAFHIYLFGAGHVGRALVNILAPLPCQIHWLEQRPNMFPTDLSGNVITQLYEQPEKLVAAAPADSFFLLMSPSHEQDFRIGEAVLERHDFAYFGMLGSAKKRQQFELRMQKRGVAPQALQNLHCPMGLSSISARQPAAIAIAIAAEILQLKQTPD